MLRGNIIGEMLDARAIKSMGGKMDPMAVLEKYRKKYRVLMAEEREMYGDIIGDIKRIFEGYERKYATDPWRYLKVEHPVTIDLIKDVRYIGYIDKVVEDKEGRKWLADHKAYRYIPNDDDRYSDLQNVFYVWAWGVQHPGEPITGFVWDYLRTKPPTIPETLKKGGLSIAKNIDTDHYTYLDAIKANNLDPKDYKETLDRLKGENSKFFKRAYMPHPEKEMIDQIVQEAKDTAVEIKNLGKRLADRNMTRDCAKGCQFYHLCQTELRGIDSEFIRTTEYMISEREEIQTYEEE
jgi:hypothetical protein